MDAKPSMHIHYIPEFKLQLMPLCINNRERYIEESSEPMVSVVFGSLVSAISAICCVMLLQVDGKQQQEISYWNSKTFFFFFALWCLPAV
ncbi:hypothetical protein L211DRAFT_625711 [Terfezia boudieri ATCC MYA-4762]|uniref:Uncharacterized protein n=1 Tax=Terfezia boudieri ATCC MYA-4762 TaxID=1051890 RepID=A0A3N4L9Q2_9PEZI|nr:hypothetical protein L211DRAFT_625711 [Terfezia boudieri ATCC MYA-4762]